MPIKLTKTDLRLVRKVMSRHYQAVLNEMRKLDVNTPEWKRLHKEYACASLIAEWKLKGF